MLKNEAPPPIDWERLKSEALERKRAGWRAAAERYGSAAPPLNIQTQIEEIEDAEAAADLCRRILRAQARTAERRRKERDDDPA